MGQYIKSVNGNPLPMTGKAQFLLDNVHGTKLAASDEPYHKDLVCVAENGPFDACAYMYSENEHKYFMQPDGRKKTWLLVPNASNYAE